VKDDLGRILKSTIHWSLIRLREPLRANDKADEDGFVEMQALSCPYYVPLRGEWGMDWGVIMHPHSVKFGQLVFEHEWCGCGTHIGAPTDPLWELLESDHDHA